MAIEYRVVSVDPIYRRVNICYSKPDTHDVYRSVEIGEITEEAIKAAAEYNAQFAVEYWRTLESAPIIQMDASYALESKPKLRLPSPSIDGNTHTLRTAEVDKGDYIEVSYYADPYTPEEMALQVEAMRPDVYRMIKEQRDFESELPCNNFDVNEKSRNRILSVIQNWDSLGYGDTINWIMADNTTQAVSKLQLSDALVQYAARLTQLFEMYLARKEQVAAATTLEELYSYAGRYISHAGQ